MVENEAYNKNIKNQKHKLNQNQIIGYKPRIPQLNNKHPHLVKPELS